MTKVTKPNKEFWESEKKPAYMKIAKDKSDASGDSHIVRFEREKSKKIKSKKD
jgi:hypothetical protein